MSRSEAVRLRTYAREKEDGTLESWADTVDRVMYHTSHLVGDRLSQQETSSLRQLILNKEVCPAGRTLWLGGTELAYRRAASQFNCSYLEISTVYDIVDSFWLLLQGCGVGFKPKPGTLQGFLKHVDLQIIPSTRGPDDKGSPDNQESWDGSTWTIKVGDSAEAWAKSLGKLLAHPYPASTLVLDFTECRGAGKRLSGYGWICNGSGTLAGAYTHVVRILNQKRGCLLDEINILDIVNHMGTVLSSRRSAQIALMDWFNPKVHEFARAKDRCWDGKKHRQQSNNSIVFWHRPTKAELRDILDLIVSCGGSEPGFVNGEAALRRAPWFSGLNPCAEILLKNQGFCNLFELNLAPFKGRSADLLEAGFLMGRANYRQTLVNLNDGILQPGWHQNNEALRLCGCSVTGVVRSNLTDYEIRQLRNAVTQGAYSMADSLGLERPRAITTIKPSGTMSKVMDTTEGIHKPLGRYIFNWIGFSIHDPLVECLRAAGYRSINHPYDSSSVLVCFPQAWEDVEFSVVDGKHVNLESALTQLKRYKRWMDNWTDHNVSNTISYSVDEIPEIVDWLYDNWDDYVAVSWLFRNDPTKTAKDLGYEYLPQEVVTQETYLEYATKIHQVDFGTVTGGDFGVESDECVGGSCPVK